MPTVEKVRQTANLLGISLYEAMAAVFPDGGRNFEEAQVIFSKTAEGSNAKKIAAEHLASFHKTIAEIEEALDNGRLKTDPALREALKEKWKSLSEQEIDAATDLKSAKKAFEDAPYDSKYEAYKKWALFCVTFEDYWEAYAKLFCFTCMSIFEINDFQREELKKCFTLCKSFKEACAAYEKVRDRDSHQTQTILDHCFKLAKTAEDFRWVFRTSAGWIGQASLIKCLQLCTFEEAWDLFDFCQCNNRGAVLKRSLELATFDQAMEMFENDNINGTWDDEGDNYWKQVFEKCLSAITSFQDAEELHSRCDINRLPDGPERALEKLIDFSATVEQAHAAFRQTPQNSEARLKAIARVYELMK